MHNSSLAYPGPITLLCHGAQYTSPSLSNSSRACFLASSDELGSFTILKDSALKCKISKGRLTIYIARHYSPSGQVDRSCVSYYQRSLELGSNVDLPGEQTRPLVYPIGQSCSFAILIMGNIQGSLCDGSPTSRVI